MDYSPSLLSKFKSIFVKLAYSRWIPSRVRVALLCCAGVKFSKGSTVFIGSNVSFDTHYPHLITVEEGAQLTQGVKLITHSVSVQPPFRKHSLGEIRIGKNVFIGTGTIILPGVVIGENTLVGASSVVTKNLESNSLYAGNPMKKIRNIIDG